MQTAAPTDSAAAAGAAAPANAWAVNPAQAREHLRWLFAWQVLSIRQKLLAIAQKYHVDDESGNPRFFVVRPPMLTGNIVAGLAGLSINIVFMVMAFRLLFQQQQFLPALALLFVGGWLASLVRSLLAPYRHIGVFTDESEVFPVLSITQDNKFGFFRRYTIVDALGGEVASARRNTIKALWRREWLAETPDGRPIARVREDSFTLAVLRRYLGPLFGVLRTNFNIELPDGTVIGEYNRKLTLTDQYLLDLRGDPWFLVDRRVALALAILLDTGEGR